MANHEGVRIAGAIKRLEEKNYIAAAGKVIGAVDAEINGKRSKVQRRLREFNKEADQLAKDGKQLTPDNKVYRKLVDDFESAMDKTESAMRRAGPGIQQAGAENADAIIRAGARNANPRLYAKFNDSWSSPDPEQINAALGFVDNPAWEASLSTYKIKNKTRARNAAIDGLVRGWGSARTARELTKSIEGSPAGVNNLIRTLFLESSRKSTALMQDHNQAVIERVIRIETLDERTCMACIALHGTTIWHRRDGGEIPAIQEHHSGRGSTVTELVGEPLDIESGEDWWGQQPAAQRQRIMKLSGASKYYGDLTSGKIKLGDFVGQYQDPVFGQMIRQQIPKRGGG